MEARAWLQREWIHKVAELEAYGGTVLDVGDAFGIAPNVDKELLVVLVGAFQISAC